ncbi:MAG: 16S rRNA (guanine(527)-N(7))-methyltransferase RsmG [Rhodospirillales bacterium]|nr:16S rRNA (guanine(527)-N(7))-methyltransferase RsmG [Rhodospirillales bacterium]
MTHQDEVAALTQKGFQEIQGASDDDLTRLEAYVELLKKWQAKMNLVGGQTLGDVWRRHILDSAQLAPLIPSSARVVADIGSGAGLPGLVLAIINKTPETKFHLIESNERKCAFLREANRITGAGAIIHHTRVENIESFQADIALSRSVAELEKLLQYANYVLKKDGQCLFLKGKKWRDELTKAQKKWIINASEIQSVSDPSGAVLILQGISHRVDS